MGDDDERTVDEIDEIEAIEEALAALADDGGEGIAASWVASLLGCLEKPRWYVLRAAGLDELDDSPEVGRLAVERVIEREDDVTVLVRARRRCRDYLDLSATDPLASEVHALLTARIQSLLAHHRAV